MLLPFLFLVPLSFSKSILPGDKRSSCSFAKGDYSLSWYYDDLSSDVVFKLSAKSALSNFWTGVLLGEEKPTDAIGVFVRSGQLGLTDGHVSENGIVPDNLTDVQSLSFDLTEDKLSAEFARPLTPQDKTDADLGRCVTFYFPVIPSEIEMGSPIEVPAGMESRKICDLAGSCSQRDSTSLVKREEAPLCEYAHGQQLVKWHHEKGHYIFSFEHPLKKGKWWSSIGAGESMQEMSMAVAFTDGGNVKNVGGYTSTGYKLPQKDPQNSHQVKLIKTNVKDGKSHYEFSVNEDFIKEKENEDGCLTLQIAVNSGQFQKGPVISKHQIIPTAVPVCRINQCQKEKTKETKPKPSKAPKTPKESVVEVKPEESNSVGTIDDNPLDGIQSIVDAQPSIPGESTVDAKNSSVAAESVVDVNPADSVVGVQGNPDLTASTDELNEQQEGDTVDALVDVKAPSNVPGESVVDTRRAENPIVDAHSTDVHPEAGTSGNETASDQTPEENIVDFREATSTPQDPEHIIDFQEKRAEEEETNPQLANGTAMVDTENPLERLVKHTQEHEEGMEKEPAESIVDFKEDTEGSGESQHLEGSGDQAQNQTVGESVDQGENSILTEGKSKNPPAVVNVDGAVEPKATTFSPPVSVPQLAADTSNAIPPAPSSTLPPQQATSTAANRVDVPKVCANPQDLRICDGYFADYLAKVQEWSTKHNHTLQRSMGKACHLLGLVKHVPSMCCNRFKKECDPYSSQA